MGEVCLKTRVPGTINPNYKSKIKIENLENVKRQQRRSRCFIEASSCVNEYCIVNVDF